MKKNIDLFCAAALMSALCAGFVACNEPQETPDPEWPERVDVPFTEYSLTGESGEEFSARWVNLYYDEKGYGGKIIVINNSKELSKYVEGKYPPIDFSKKTLLLIYGEHSGTAFGHNKLNKFQQISERNHLLTAYAKLTLAAFVSQWQFAVVVDKLPSDSNVELKTIIETGAI